MMKLLGFGQDKEIFIIFTNLEKKQISNLKKKLKDYFDIPK